MQDANWEGYPDTLGLRIPIGLLVVFMIASYRENPVPGVLIGLHPSS